MVVCCCVLLFTMSCGLSLIEAFPYRETIRVVQHDKAHRMRREEVPTDLYPTTMRFDLHMKHRTVPLKLTKHRVSLPNVTVMEEGQVKTVDHNQDGMENSFGVYADQFSSAAIIVKCDASTDDDCHLKGTFYSGSQKFRIEPIARGHSNRSHVVERIMETESLVGIPKIKDLASMNDEDIREFVKKRSVNNEPSPDMPIAKSREKREVPSGCLVVETGIIVESQIWEFFLELADDDVTDATNNLMEYYCAIFTEVDLRFCSLLENGRCIRVYLAQIHIQMTSAESWTNGHVDEANGLLDKNILLDCDSIARSLLSNTDYNMCFTRWNIISNGDPEIRGYGYTGSLCRGESEPDYASGIVESIGDDSGLLIAHLISFGFNVSNDINTVCGDNDYYIMSLFNFPPEDPANRLNPWIFSNCSVMAFETFIDGLGAENCLTDNRFTDAEFAEKLLDQQYPGALYDVNFQCAFTYGMESVPCMGPEESTILFIDDICYRGVWCTTEGQCQNRTRVLDGTPCAEGKICIKNSCETVPVTIQCTCENPECDDANAMCDLNTETCSCASGYSLDENGECILDVAVGDSCDAMTVCIANAACNLGTSECECNDGFFLDESGDCVPVLDLCTSCTDSGECAGPNTECNGDTSSCKCIDGYSTNDCGVCTQDVGLGENCAELDCADEWGFCHPETNLCVCVGDTFDDNGADTSGGTCMQKVANTDTCNQPDACMDRFAFCNSESTCECLPGFTLNAANDCILASELCETCAADSDCKDTNAECVDSECLCKSEYSIDSCGVCQKDIILGGNCSSGVRCADSNAVCSPDDICVCFGNTFDDNTVDILGGTCIPKVDVGDVCLDDNSCSDDLAICNGDQLCECRGGFTLYAANTCGPLLELCETCNDDSDCKDTNAECVDSECLCKSEYSIDSCGVCQKDIILGGNCSSGVRCADSNAVCSPDDICVCFGNTFDDNTVDILGGTCIPKVDVGDVCLDDNSCSDDLAICNGDQLCECRGGFTLYAANTCGPLLELCETCNDDSDCKDTNAECVDSECSCKSEYSIDSCGVCQKDIILGGNCSSGVRCADSNAVCSPDDICVCFGNTFDDNTVDILGGTCIPKVDIGDSCLDDNSCSDDLAICNGDQLCECREGFTLYAANTCGPLLELCETCNDNSDCKDTNAECVGSECLCKSEYSIDSCGVCQKDIILGGNCSSGVRCADSNAVCSPEDICVCFGDTFDDDTAAVLGGTCMPKIPNGGGPCSQADACIDPNAECSASECRCQDGFELDINNDCIPVQCEPCDPTGLCSACATDTDCTKANTECVDDKCQCVPEYSVDSCGECRPNIAVGGDCTNGVNCRDPNASCDPAGVCTCVCDRYASEGNCIPKIQNNDGPCTQDDECIDPNAECSASECRCQDGFELDINNDCIPVQCEPCDPTGLCSACATDTDCTKANTECVDDKCQCVPEYSVDSCGECRPNIAVGGDCTNGVNCMDPNASCDPAGVCTCVCDRYASEGNCIPKIQNNDGPCTQNDECIDPNAECNGVSGCGCQDGFELDMNNDCVPEQCESCESCDSCDPSNQCGLCDTCEGDGDCMEANTECIGMECRCMSGYYVDACGECQPKLGLGSNCSMDAMCKDENAVCDPETMTCVCFGNFYDSNHCTMPGGECSPKVNTGETCTQPDACIDVHAFCSRQSMCTCYEGFYANATAVCIPAKGLCDECDATAECGGTNVVCSDEGSSNQECQCAPGYDIDGCGTCVEDGSQ